MSLEELVRQAAREHWESIRREWEAQGFDEPNWDDLSSDKHVFYMKQVEIPVAVACRERDATIARLEAELEEIRIAAREVCWFDWSENDEDAVEAVDKLRSLTQEKADV